MASSIDLGRYEWVPSIAGAGGGGVTFTLELHDVAGRIQSGRCVRTFDTTIDRFAPALNNTVNLAPPSLSSASRSTSTVYATPRLYCQTRTSMDHRSAGRRLEGWQALLCFWTSFCSFDNVAVCIEGRQGERQLGSWTVGDGMKRRDQCGRDGHHRGNDHLTHIPWGFCRLDFGPLKIMTIAQ